MEKHAYLIMAYHEFTMLKKLLREIDDERNDIFLHIDKKAPYVNQEEIASWVRYSKLFFMPRMRIYWGTYSIVRCELKLLKAAVKNRYSYYHLISGVDLPLKTQDEIHFFFQDKDEEYVPYHKEGDLDDHFAYKLKYYFPLLRFVGKGEFSGNGIRTRMLKKLLSYQYELMIFQEKHHIDRTQNYGEKTLYKGEQWFSITHDLAVFVCQNSQVIRQMFFCTNGPDEFLMPMLAMNSSFANRMVDCGLRKIDWKRGAPYEFCDGDLEELLKDDALFARKVSYERSPLLVESVIRDLHRRRNSDGTWKADESPLISIIVPCYNVVEYLGECVDSLIVQDYSPIEVLLIDDGAMDSTGAIADEYAENHGNVFCVHTKNSGLSAARNKGIELSRGAYIAFVDSDDWVEPNYVSKLYEAVCKWHTDIAICGYMEEENADSVRSFENTGIVSSHEALRIMGDIYHKENVLFVVVPTKLYRRDTFDTLRFPEGMIHEDEFISHRLIGTTDCVATITDVLYHYRIRNGSITSAANQQNVRHLDFLDGMADRLNYVCNMYYADLKRTMLQAFLKGMHERVLSFSEQTIREERLAFYFRKRAIAMLFKHFGAMSLRQRIEYLKICLSPLKMRRIILVERAKRENEPKA